MYSYITGEEYNEFLREQIEDAIHKQEKEFTFEDIIKKLPRSFDCYVANTFIPYELLGQYSHYIYDDVEENVKKNGMSIAHATIYTIHQKTKKILYKIKKQIEEILNNKNINPVDKRRKTLELVKYLHITEYGNVA